MIPTVKLTPFGRAVRKARLELGISLLIMAKELKVTLAFLSGMETGRKKIPLEWAQKIEVYFELKGYAIHDLKMLTYLSNQTVSLKGLPIQQQVLIAYLAAQIFSWGQMDDVKHTLGRVLAGHCPETNALIEEQALAHIREKYVNMLKILEDM